jgi:serine/threonine protein kinase
MPRSDEISPPSDGVKRIPSTLPEEGTTLGPGEGDEDVTAELGGEPGTVTFAYQSDHVPDHAFPTTLRLPGESTDREPEPPVEVVAKFGSESLPDRIGRYRVTRKVGSGGFGIVYQGLDEELRRDVAIKVPHLSRLSSTESVNAFLAEGRMIAGLDHPGIVPIYDVGLTEDGRCYLVSKFIPGCDLSAQLKDGRPTPLAAAKLLLQVAEALNHAHRRGLIHRDIKPANILIDRDGHPILTDFGLARRDDDAALGPLFAGSPPYMSPEQTRLETHLVDARTDIYSLGVVFYELLTGRRPFRAAARSALFQQIQSCEPRPPRQIDETIPHELQRVCLKALSKRISDRFATALELAEDLRCWLARHRLAGPSLDDRGDSSALDYPSTISAEEELSRVVPRGLRSFDDEDSDFFLGLLPGPRERDGLPSSVRFWKTRLDSTDPDRSFRVGLIYGPSGSGKSSFVKAGLLPNLAENVHPIYLEASAIDTEDRLLRRLRDSWPNPTADLGLAASITRIRQCQGLHPGRKLLIVIDQFEQWLLDRTPEPTLELVQALRQCDGGRVQCLLLARDDFWMSITRFMREIEVPVAEGQNSGSLDLFDSRHARNVLAGFGRAFGSLPPGPLPAEQERFLDRAVAELAQDDRVIPVRLALFGEMFRGKTWSVAALKEVGGTQGIGVAFLEEMLGEHAGKPGHRVHQKAARAVLQSLLPEPGREIKGQKRSYQELLEASGYAANPREFAELLRLLDAELRLITPSDPLLPSTAEPSRSMDSDEARRLKHYQLSHDYLIQPLRHWLSAKQRATLSGRVELRLAERASLWTAKPENRQLPSWSEWAQILVLGRGTPWSNAQARMMAVATRFHVRQGLIAAGLLGLCLTAGLWFRDRLHQRLQATHAEALVSKLLDADIDRVPDIINELDGYRAWADPRLASVADASNRPARQKLHASMALLPSEPGRTSYLTDRMLAAGPEELVVIRSQLEPHKDRLKADLWGQLDDGLAMTPEKKLRLACALAAYDPDSARWDDLAPTIAGQLVKENTLLLRQWLRALRPASRHLTGPLAAIYRGNDPTARDVATVILSEYAAGDGAFLAELIKDADVRQFNALIGLLEPHRSTALAAMKDELGRVVPREATEEEKEARARRQANAAVTLYRSEEFAPVWPLLQHSGDPRARSYLIHALAALGADPAPLVARWRDEPDVTGRRALLIALGELGPERLSIEARRPFLDEILKAYRDDPDPGIHGASAWLLGRWGSDDQVRAIDRELVGRKPAGDRSWYVTREGHTMVLVNDPGDVPRGEKGRTFAIGSKAVSIGQFLGLRPSYFHLAPPEMEHEYPAVVVSWYDAAAYCRWLSEQEGISEDQMCYPPLAEIKKGMVIPDDYLRRTGYRLPTEWEYEQASRAGATTSRFFGESDSLLMKYAWYQDNSENKPQPSGRLKPNDLGLFDMMGNTMAWCHGIADGAPTPEGREVPVVQDDTPRATRGGGYVHRPEGVRCTQRDIFPATTSWHSIGFRVARTLPARP